MTSWPQDPGPQHDSAEEATTMTIQQDDLVMADGTIGTDDAMPSASSSRRIGIFIMAVIVVVALVLFGFALAPLSPSQVREELLSIRGLLLA